MADSIKRAVKVLNEALELDADAITRLVNMGVDCDASLAGHPTIRVSRYGDTDRIGVLGLINGAIGNSPTSDIGAEGPLDEKTGTFSRIKRFVDLREEKLDVLA